MNKISKIMNLVAEARCAEEATGQKIKFVHNQTSGVKEIASFWKPVSCTFISYVIFAKLVARESSGNKNCAFCESSSTSFRNLHQANVSENVGPQHGSESVIKG